LRGWSLAQQFAAGFLVFDLFGGAMAYNSGPSKVDRFKRSGLCGATVYLALLLFSIVVFRSSLRAQSMVAASIVVLMCLLNGTVISVPPGFNWLVPVFFVKLILGYMARTRIALAAPASA
jgi:hypothetical protein